MTSVESPAVARRRLCLTLRTLRESRGATQAQVAAALDWSSSKVIRIERGDVTISKNDLTALLTYYQVAEQETIDHLVEEARTARRRGWWAEPRFREHLTPALVQLLQYETEAHEIRSFQSAVIPGLFQTEEYAAAIFSLWKGELPESTRSARLEIRTRRRSHVFDRAPRPQYLLILDESVLWREMGGPAVMAAQLDELLRVIHEGQVSVRVLALSDPGMAPFVGPFTLIDLGEANVVLYWEAQFRDYILQNADELALHRRIFEQMWHNALDEGSTVDLITARSAAVKAFISRHRRAS